jgi:hypothetical protein
MGSMTYEITELENNVTKIEVDFSDEEINLQGETRVKGDSEVAERYVKIFEKDLRRNNKELFPEPELPEPEEEEMM